MITSTGTWMQAAIETGNAGIGKAVRALRSAGFEARSVRIGPQVTPVGRICLTLIDVRPGTHDFVYGAGHILRKHIANIDW